MNNQELTDAILQLNWDYTTDDGRKLILALLNKERPEKHEGNRLLFKEGWDR